jgi:carboxyl-terminal processing protease
MDFFKKNNLYSFIVIGAGIFFACGFFVGRLYPPEIYKNSVLTNKEGPATVDFSPFWKAWNVIDEKYVPTNGTTTDKVAAETRIYGAISGMVNSLGDPYTEFFPPVESKKFNEEIRGNFEGVGMEVGMRDGVLTVISPLKGTPAYRAGIKAGDKILKINETLTSGLSTDQAINLIRGKAGTSVKLTLVREGVKDPLEIQVVRDVINIPTIDTETKGDVFVIHLYNFDALSAGSFRGALREFVESGKSRLVLDLRGNPGGYLDAAIDMASWFLPAGKVVVKEDFRNAQDAQIYRSKGYDIFNSNLKMVILIDGGSASASEILTGALQENGVATVVGDKSFGKGSVQELVPITDDTSLKVTIAKWLTPNGNSISHNGITPDIVIKLDTDLFKKGTDNQLNKAIEILDIK